MPGDELEQAARDLVEKQDSEEWARSLKDEDGSTNSALIDKVVQVLPETKNPEHVSSTVKAFIEAELQSELMELLERLLLQGSDFTENKNLQNLLIVTAAKADKGRVAEYINRLDSFDGPEIAKVIMSENIQLYEEGFAIYNKFAKSAQTDEARSELQVQAIGVLIDQIKDTERARQYAGSCDEAKVWS